MLVSQGFVDADTNKDGVIDYEELISVFNGMIQARKQQQPDQSGAADVPLSYDPALFTAAELEIYVKVGIRCWSAVCVDACCCRSCSQSQMRMVTVYCSLQRWRNCCR